MERTLRRVSLELLLGSVINQQNNEVVTVSHLATIEAVERAPPSFKKSLWALLIMFQVYILYMAGSLILVSFMLLRNYGVMDLISKSTGVSRRFLGFLSKLIFNLY